MTRKDFISTLGIGAAFALTVGCLGGCSKEGITPVDPNVDFTIDLTDNAYRNLQQNGGYIVKDRIVVARTTDGNLVAATQLCSHENKYQIILKNDEWFCTDHDARFNLNGEGLNKEGKKGIAIYQTELNGDLLRVFA